ncbi:MAG: hypothetical protein AAFR52_19020, partial [Pseudomonadota bacterium]
IAARDQPAIEAIPEIAIAVPRGREGGPAPYGMRFEVAGLEGTVGNILRHAEFRWDYGESYQYRTMPGDRRFALDARYSRGPWGAHAYVTPGRYTVAVEVTIAPGRTARATTEVTITDPDKVFHGGHTIVYSKDGNFRGAPPGAKRASNLARALDIARAGRSAKGPRARVLLRAGETTVIGKALALPNIYLGRFGEGANPIITYAPERVPKHIFKLGERGRDGTGMSISSIDVRGLYDASNPAMPPDPSIHTTFAHTRAAMPHLTLYDIRTSGLRMLGIKTHNMIVANSEFTNWYDYGHLGGGVLAFMGNLIHQHPEAKLGPGAKERNLPGTPNFADHGPMRTSASRRMIISQNYLFSNTGWSGGGIVKWAHQPALRSGADAGKRAVEYIGENHLHGGATLYAATVHRGTKPTEEPPSLIIMANNILEATYATGRFAQVGRSDFVMRNNLFLYDATDYEIGNHTLYGLIMVTGDAARLPRLVGGQYAIHNNTLMFRLKPFMKARPLNWGKGAADLQRSNNIVSVRGGKGKERGPDLDARFAPTDSRPAGDGRRALIDLYGRPRPADATGGAVEPQG